MIIPKTLNDAFDDGYIVDKVTRVRGYISMEVKALDRPVKLRTDKRNYKLYVELPCPRSTIYHYRCYLIKPIDK